MPIQPIHRLLFCSPDFWSSRIWSDTSSRSTLFSLIQSPLRHNAPSKRRLLTRRWSSRWHITFHHHHHHHTPPSWLQIGCGCVWHYALLCLQIVTDVPSEVFCSRAVSYSSTRGTPGTPPLRRSLFLAAPARAILFGAPRLFDPRDSLSPSSLSLFFFIPAFVLLTRAGQFNCCCRFCLGGITASLGFLFF